MATPLDTTLVTFLSPIFVFILVFAIFFALLKKFKIFGDSTENLSAIVSFSLAILAVLTPAGRTVVTTMTPMFAIFFLFVFLVILFILFLGVKEKDVTEYISKGGVVMTVIIAGSIIIFLIALTNAFGPIFQVTGETGFWESTKRVIFSSRMLGALFLLVIASYAVRYIGSSK